MSATAKLLHDIFDQIGVAAIVILLYSEAVRRCPATGSCRNIALAAIFGGGVAFAMLDPPEIRTGIFIDGRHILIGLGMFLIGPVGAAVTLTVGFAMRIGAGGDGLAAGLAGMVITAAAAGWLRIALGEARRMPALATAILLGLATSLSLLSAFALPLEVALQVLRTGGVTVFLSNMLGCIVVSLLLAREGRRISAERTDQIASRTDVLTGLANRRRFEEVLSTLASGQERNVSTALVLVDIDQFKKINDSYGHERGDAVLRGVASVIRRQTRSTDLAARIGGDEFAVILKGASLPVAKDVADRICAEVAQGLIDQTQVTVSAGISSLPSAEGTRIDLVRTADKAMYEAKRAGRSRVSTGSATRC